MSSLPSYLIELHDLAIPLVLADVIVIFSVICFNMWSSRVEKIRLDIDQLNQKIATFNNDNYKELIALLQEQKIDDSIQKFLQETRASWMMFPQSGNQSEAMQTLRSYRAYTEIWHIRKVLNSKINLELLEAMPNLLVGFGLMCTFAFLAAALIQTGQGLRAMDMSSIQQEAILQNLIATAGGKFIVSIAGLLCSLVWNWRTKVMMSKLQKSLDALCNTLKNTVPDNAVQLFIQSQLHLLQDIKTAIRSIPHAQSTNLDTNNIAH